MQQPPFVVSGRGLAAADGEPEFTEGFVFYLKVDRDSLHESDRDRLQIVNPVVLVTIRNNNREQQRANTLYSTLFIMGFIFSQFH